jgi:hypothetical protein
MLFTRFQDSSIAGSVILRKWCLVRTAVAILALVNCSRGQAPTDAPADATAAATTEQESSAAAGTSVPDAWKPDAERKSLPPDRIYYTLTDYPWYARGEPLLYQGRPHVPAGVPIAASVEEMQKAGVYEGVEFYTRREDSDSTLYVPVFEGYWLAFRPSLTIGAANVAKSAAQ